MNLSIFSAICNKFRNLIRYLLSQGKLLLEKNDEKWMINKKYRAWQYRVEYTLKVMKDIRIKSSVPESSEEMVIKDIATSGVKIEIHGYQGKKIYYIGGNTKDHLGTYMIMNKSSTPFIMHIPDRHPGILNPKYGLEGNLVDYNIWREPITITIPKDSIKEILIKDLRNDNQSFYINLHNKELRDIHNKKITIDPIKIINFASHFEELKCGKFKPNLKTSDFILSKKIYIKHGDNTDSLIIYETTPKQKNKKEFNPTVESIYATWNRSDIVIIQKQIFNKVLITLDQFIQ